MYTAFRVARDSYEPLIKYNLQFFAEDANGAEKSEEPTAKSFRTPERKARLLRARRLQPHFLYLHFS